MGWRRLLHPASRIRQPLATRRSRLTYAAHSRFDPCLPVLVCHCACPDADTAERLAQRLVEERLAACVNVLPGMRSVYRWQGTVERADEVLLMIKTSSERLAALTERVIALHPYELPELVAVEAAGGSAAWLEWVAAETRTGAA